MNVTRIVLGLADFVVAAVAAMFLLFLLITGGVISAPGITPIGWAFIALTAAFMLAHLIAGVGMFSTRFVPYWLLTAAVVVGVGVGLLWFGGMALLDAAALRFGSGGVERWEFNVIWMTDTLRRALYTVLTLLPLLLSYFVARRRRRRGPRRS